MNGQDWFVLFFYIAAALLIYLFRSKFEFQGIIALLRTKLGLDFMKNTGERYSRFWVFIAPFVIFIGFLGMAFMVYMLFYGVYSLIFLPDALPVLSPVIPGVKIPGSPFHFPLGYTLIALFFAVVVHEAAHGVYSAAFKIKIKSSGFAFFGPIPGAFVEPDEEVLLKRPKKEQLAIMAAGPFSNVVLGVIVLVVMIGLGALGNSLSLNDGVKYGALQNNTSAINAGFPETGVISALDGKPINDARELTAKLAEYSPGANAVFTIDAKEYPTTLGVHPNDPQKAYVGVLAPQTVMPLWFEILSKILEFTFLISVGIGIANLIPAGPLDGGRMFYLALTSRFNEKRAKEIFSRWSWFLLFIIVILIFIPIGKAIL